MTLFRNLKLETTDLLATLVDATSLEAKCTLKR